jgi:hypothetical protein
MGEKQAPEEDERRRATVRRIGFVLVLALFPVLVPFVVLALAVYFFWALLLRLLVLVLWFPRGHRVLVIYSNSPHWKAYFEERIVPRLGASCVVLNWSHRRRWRHTLARCLFRFYGGPKAYNPLVVVMPAFGRAAVFRFWPAFRDLKRGCPELLRRLETELFSTASGRGAESEDLKLPR